jgi:hypothetical protein
LQIITTYHPAFILLCAIIGALVSWFLYYRDKNLSDFSRNLILFLSFLRFAGFTLLAFFLLEPMLKFVRQEVEKPVIVIGIDNSESMVMTKDSTQTQTLLTEGIAQLREQLGDRFDVRTYTFGDRVREENNLNFSDKETDISALIDEVYNRYSNRNLGAVVLATDGIYNRGFNPLHQSQKIKAPVFTIALGDTTRQKDLLIKEVLHNQLAYLGNDFPVEILMEANGFSGRTSRLSISHKGNEVASSQVQFGQEADQQILKFTLSANATGIQRYTVALQPLDGEFTLLNNTRDIYIEVLDSKQKVLLLANSPHPDIRAIEESINENDNYTIDIRLAGESIQNLAGYNLVILHGLPSQTHGIADVVSNLREKTLPTWIVITGQTDINLLNQMKAGITISGLRSGANDAGSSFNPAFSLFNMEPDQGNHFGKLPPLSAPFGTFKVTAQGQSLMNQRIGTVTTDFPLFVFCEQDGWKTGILAGEGIWRWRLMSYAEKASHSTFNTLIQKTVQYLAAKENKSYFRVFGSSTFKENEEIIFRAERYNKSYELITEPEVQMTITDSEGNQFDFNFSRSAQAYRLSAGTLPAGNYSYTATSMSDEGALVLKGEFSVAAINIETASSAANHQLLYQLSQETGGQMVYPENLNGLAQMIDSNKEIAGIIYTKKELADLINLRWIFFVILALFAIEWYIRKRNGAY